MERNLERSGSVNFQGGPVVVTGGTGFLGAYIIRNLVEKGFPVRALYRKSRLPFFIPSSIEEKVQWIEGDVLDVVSLDEAMQDAEGLIHAAAIVSFSRQNRSLMYQVNVEGTANVINTAIENGIRRFIHVSSVAALGRTARREIVDENKKWEANPSNTHYAISKHHSEMHAWRGFAEGLQGVIINPSTILGFGDWNKSSCAIFKNAYREFSWYTRGINGFVGVEDVAEVAVRLLMSDIDQKKFIVNSENWEFRKVFETIALEFHKKPPYREASRTMGELAWRFESVKSFLTGQKALLTRETAKLAHSKTSFDNKAMLKLLPGFSYTPIETVIKKACSKYVKALENGDLS